MISRLTDTLEFQSQALALRAERQRVIASNIANADTPGYHARDFDFAQALRAATGSAGDGIGQDIAAGVGRGVAGDAAGGTPPPVLRYTRPVQTNLDSNSVDMDRERAAFVDNAVKVEATLRFINGSVRSLLDAMKSHTHG